VTAAAGRLAGKRALITGGAGGIGAATVHLFRHEGSHVAVVDMVDVPEVVSVRANISNEGEAQRAVEEAVERLGGLDILVNNAAARDYGSLAERTGEHWQRVLAVNVLGAASCTRAALPALRERGGAIVIVSSVFGVVARANMGIYDATKAALLSMTRTLAVEEAPHGIRVNAVCPGSTWTRYTAGRAEARGMSQQELHERGAVGSLLNRWAEPEEIAFPILWLASDEASFVTGASLMVDGGLSAI